MQLVQRLSISCWFSSRRFGGWAFFLEDSLLQREGARNGVLCSFYYTHSLYYVQIQLLSGDSV